MDTLLALNLAPELEEDLVDYLLQLDCVSGFTSSVVYGHGRHGHMTLAEQVTGRRRRVQVEMMIADEDMSRVLEGLAEHVGRGITYWYSPIAGHGSIE